MKMKRTIALATLAVVLGTALLLTQRAWSGGDRVAFKLAGTWVEKYSAIPFLATYTMTPLEPNAQSASLQGAAVTTDPTLLGRFPEAQYITPLVGRMDATGPETAVHTVLWYGLKMSAVGAEIVYIALDSGTQRRIASGKVEVTHNVAFYEPTQDADGDGLPDEGQSPVFCVPNIVSIDKVLPQFSPCTQ